MTPREENTMYLRHEMRHMPEVASWLHWAIRRVLEPQGWVLESKLGGYNSYWLRKDGDDRQFHFRWHKETPDTVFVRDRYIGGVRIGRLTTEEDVVRFVVKVKSGRAFKGLTGAAFTGAAA